MGYDWKEYYKRKQRESGIVVKKSTPEKMHPNDNGAAIKACALPDTVIPKIENTLQDFIRCVGNDFQQYVSTEDELCKISRLFNDGESPDYEDINIQQLYLLRFVYAYAFENKEMYTWVLKDRGTCNNLSVESIGCGCGVDSWALQYAARSLGMQTNAIKHKGIDLVHWSYQLGTVQSDFLKINAADYFDKIPSLDSEVYIFPRSIGDFSYKDFKRICYDFSWKKIKHKTIYLLISQRKGDKKVSDEDILRTEQLCEALESRHYRCVARLYKPSTMTKGLNYYDDYFDEYPPDILALLKELRKECTCDGKKQQCKSGCSLGKQPIFLTERLCYSVFKFERK